MSRKKISHRLRREVLELNGLYCRYCGTGPMMPHWGTDARGRVRLYQGELDLDHVVPVINGGPTTADNLVVSCVGCNRRKYVGPARPVHPPAPMCFLPGPTAAEIRRRWDVHFRTRRQGMAMA